jgi:hypothetical protein
VATVAQAQTVTAGSWSSAGSLTALRSGATASTLLDGRVLITGGTSGNTSLSSTEIYDGKSFTAAPSLSVARSQHTAVTLKDGRVLIAGGYTSGGVPTTSIEMYDPQTNSWNSSLIGMAQARAGHTMTILSDGRVLIAGGMGTSGPLASVEIFDPTLLSCSLLGATMSSPRVNHVAAILANGAVLLGGGYDGTSVLSSVDAYDPALNAMVRPLTMSSPRQNFSATTLLDGRVLLAGGNNGSSDVSLLEIADVTTGMISAIGSLSVARSGHAAIRLPQNGNILIAGGVSGGTPTPTAEIFSPVNSKVVSAGNMSVARSGAVVAGFESSGLVYALLGGGESSGATSTGDIYSFPTVSSDRPDYAPNTTVTIRGNGWTPGETVSILLHESPTIDADRTLSAAADASGAIQNTSFKPDVHDLTVNFVVTATGSLSGASAQTIFSDSTYGTTLSSPTPTSGNAGASVTVSAALQYGVPQYQVQYYQYQCNCYSCNCGWFSCNTCCNWCTGYNYIYTGTTYTKLANQPVQFSFNNGSPVTVTTDANGVATASLSVPVGATSLTASYAGSNDGTYGASTAVSNFTVTNLAATLTVPTVSATYGNSQASIGANLTSGSSPVPNKTVSFTVDGNSVGSATTDSAGHAVVNVSISGFGAGNHAISASFAGDTSYLASSGSGTLTVNPAALTITANNQFKIYGQTLLFSGTEFTAIGLVNSDTITGVALASAGAGPGATAGIYPIVPSAAVGTGLSNYVPSYVNGALTVNPATSIIGWNNPGDISYGTPLGSSQLNATATFNGSPVPGVFTYTPAAGTVLNAGSSQTLSVHFAPSDTVDFTAADATVVINVLKATPVITWKNPADVTYPTPLSSTQLNASILPSGAAGFWPAEEGSGTTSQNLVGADIATLVNGASWGPGKIGTAFSLNGNAQYLDAGNTADLQVSQGDFTVGAWVNFSALSGEMSIVDKMGSASSVNDDGWRLFKQADNHFAFCIGQTPGVNTCGGVQSATVATTGVWYHVTAVKTSSTISIYVNGQLENTSTVGPIYDLNDANLRFGSYVTQGDYLNGEADEVVLFSRALSPSEISNIWNGTQSTHGTFTYDPPPGTVLNVGSGQTLSATFTPTDNSDFNPATVSVTINVNKATTVVTWATPAAITYGTALSGTQLNATANVAGSFSYSPGTGTILNAGSQTLTVSFTPTDANDYSPSSATVSLTVSAATLTVTANSQTKAFGQPDPSLTYAASGFQSTDSASTVLTGALTRTAGETVVGSPYPISQGTLSATGNYKIQFTGSTLTISPAQTSATVTSSLNPSTFGQSVTFMLAVRNAASGSGTGSGSPSTAAPTGAVNFTIDGAPTAATPTTCSSGTPAYSACFSVSTSSLNAGPHSVVATFTDAAGNLQSSSGSMTQTVNKASTLTSVSS